MEHIRNFFARRITSSTRISENQIEDAWLGRFCSTVHNIPERYANSGYSNFECSTPAMSKVVKYMRDLPADRSVLLTGGTGSGKTHLAIACARNLLPVDASVVYNLGLPTYDPTHRIDGMRDKLRAIEGNPEHADELPFLYFTVDLAGELRPAQAGFYSVPNVAATYSVSSFDTKERILTNLTTFRGHVILDDFGAHRSSDAVAELFYTVVNERYNFNRPTIITSNLTLSEIYGIDARIGSRIEETYGVVHLDFPDYRQAIRTRRNGGAA